MLEHITIEPQTPAKKAVIWLHGLGADGADFEPIVPQLKQQDTRFIFPHAPVRPITINGGMAMRAWFDIHGLDLESRVDWEGLEAAEQDIVELINQQIAAGIPSNQIYLAGFSQGGALALYTGLRFNQKLAGVIGLSTFLPIQHPITCDPSNQDTPFFVAHGSKDNVVPVVFGNMITQWLQHKGYTVDWHEYKMAHQVCGEEITDLARWLSR